MDPAQLSDYGGASAQKLTHCEEPRIVNKDTEKLKGTTIEQDNELTGRLNNAIPPTSSPGSQSWAPLYARIPRYCFAEDKYWFVIETLMEDNRCWELSRYYEDFYSFHVALLAKFPAEAGNTGTQKRSLPYLPGPVRYVTDTITEDRLYHLDYYVKKLLDQPQHISRCNLVKQFFAPMEGDYEIDQNDADDEYQLSGSPNSL
ncbi:Protein scd2/ral3 [Cytospora mali]|uniref:Protein scd2/ral3 n=1 Tax=Cytospora mali TaxID=578113 RepID=A0A194V3Y4_CYTMA|nr:Protein scd2/ral3 [Valsa mali var. pyri (nom. inval.)]